MISDFIKSVVGVMVLIIVIVAIAVPTLGTLELSETVTINEGDTYYSPIDKDSDITIKIEGRQANYTITVNGVVYDFTNIDDDFTTYIIQTDAFDLTASEVTPHLSVAYDTEWYTYGTLTISDGHASYIGEDGTEQFEIDFFGGFCIDPDGGYVRESSFNVRPGTVLEWFRPTAYYSVCISWSVSENGFTMVDVVGKFPNGGDVTMAVVEVSDWGDTMIEPEGEMLHIDMGKISFHVGSTNSRATPHFFVEATETITDENKEAIESIVHIIPLIMVVGVVIAAVYAFIRRSS